MTLADLLLRAADLNPDRPAVRSSGGELTYAKLADRSLRLAGALVEHGLEPGDRVMICLGKDLALPVAIFGTLLAGGVYVPVDLLTPPARARTIAADADPVAVIAGTRTMQAIQGAAGTTRVDNVPALHWTGSGRFRPDGSARPVRSRTIQSIYETEAFAKYDVPVLVPSTALAYFLYTSGSTGIPKGVAHTHSSALAFVRWAVDRLDLNPTDVLSQHASASFDLSVFDFFGAAMASARLALVPGSTFGRVAAVCRFIADTGVTVWYSVPSVLLRGNGSHAALRDSSLRQVVLAGEEIPVGPLRALWSDLPPSCRVANWYGPTETNVCTWHEITRSDLDTGDGIPIGRPCPYADTSLRAGPETVAADAVPSATAAPADRSRTATGELLVASPTLMAGYWNRPEETAAALSTGSDGRVHYATGDLVSRDASGRMVFRGRVDRMIKIRGYRVQPEEVEQILERADGVEVAAVVEVGFAGEDVLAAVVEAATGPEVSPRELVKHCRAFLPAWMIPEIVLLVNEMPRGTRGKVDLQAVRELLRPELDADPAPDRIPAHQVPR